MDKKVVEGVPARLEEFYRRAWGISENGVHNRRGANLSRVHGIRQGQVMGIKSALERAEEVEVGSRRSVVARLDVWKGTSRSGQGVFQG